jgi:hypothetical protein
VSQHWMIMDETGSNYYDVEYSRGMYSCSCSRWKMNNDRHSYKLAPGPCKHINAVNGSKVSVRQRKYGHIVRMR